MEIDHIFIFSSNDGRESDYLVEFGLTEGSSRLHPGQGTTNRKFYFENFFLEVLWVVDEKEIQSNYTSKTKLWERSQFDTNGNSRFGLCLVNSAATDELFKRSEIYQPEYFPKSMSIDMLTNEQYPELPWTFRLPYRDKKIVHNEPTEHPNEIRTLTKTQFEIENKNGKTEFEGYFENVENIEFTKEERTNVILEFDHKIQGKIKEFSELDLTIKY